MTDEQGRREDRPGAHHLRVEGRIGGHSVQAGRIDGGVHIHPTAPATRRRAVFLWLAPALTLVVAVAAFVFWLYGPRTTAAPGPGGDGNRAGDPPHHDVPLTAKVSTVHGCPGGNWVVPQGVDLAALPPADALNDEWARRQGAVAASQAVYSITIQGKSPSVAVVLQQMRVKVLDREPAPSTGVLVRTCTGAGDKFPRHFRVDLDQKTPRATPLAGDGPEPGDGQGEPAVGFPYQVSATDTEVFWLFAVTRAHTVRWRVELDWTAMGRTGTYTIDHDGDPLRTAAGDALPGHDHT
ncbi:hypothetical protein LX15_002713 [Streptoalloteichus tenebrarius]|uniref:Uncharacterized protein n=1 Tax=Streptoalloteichus tenebrarius (strain ATCC 17920 / DSM 40477 / JCM 4838 / CBS 697.72 / NBRC 16177 / NCIMB 11028 / NRRL B-12390 / A12253. 1 / ISP 5477) TaxID=1933 RepID=A0ABT1HU22_STRSD|nr:hypothetical protein [Streptoalloteichus tenebrarius]MCP2259014.1 hypothetical protein [Streptoalloteichus tenebrarius]